MVTSLGCEAVVKGDRLYVVGKTNRAQVAFEQEVLDILDRLSSQPKQVSNQQS